jgi:hypothetical protein
MHLFSHFCLRGAPQVLRYKGGGGCHGAKTSKELFVNDLDVERLH